MHIYDILDPKEDSGGSVTEVLEVALREVYDGLLLLLPWPPTNSSSSPPLCRLVHLP
jgi:hypothetical protein